MLPRAVLVLLLGLAARGLALQTRETVQRVVLLRTSGSDLAPAASGYTYRKRDDGRESVVHMAEQEVMAQLASMDDADDASARRVIPVREDAGDHDGLADVDYSKLFDEHRPSYDDYLDHFKRFKSRLHHAYGADSAENGEGSKGHRYGDGDTGSYRNAKFESYSISGGHEKGRHDDDGHDHGPRRDRHGFHAGFGDSDKDSQEYFGARHKAFPDAHNYYRADGRGREYSAYDDKHHGAQLAGEASVDKPSEGLAAPTQLAEAPAQLAEASAQHAEAPARLPEAPETPAGGQAESKSYGYKIEH